MYTEAGACGGHRYPNEARRPYGVGEEKAGGRGFYNLLALTSKGRDVRDMALLRQSLLRPMRLYKLLKRSPVYWPPVWGDRDGSDTTHGGA